MAGEELQEVVAALETVGSGPRERQQAEESVLRHRSTSAGLRGGAGAKTPGPPDENRRHRGRGRSARRCRVAPAARPGAERRSLTDSSGVDAEGSWPETPKRRSRPEVREIVQPRLTCRWGRRYCPLATGLAWPCGDGGGNSRRASTRTDCRHRPTGRQPVGPDVQAELVMSRQSAGDWPRLPTGARGRSRTPPPARRRPTARRRARRACWATHPCSPAGVRPASSRAPGAAHCG